MSTQLGLGFSQQPSTAQAAREAALEAKSQLSSYPIDFVIVFATAHYGPLETLRSIRQALGEPKTIGCTTSVVITGDKIATQGIGILVIQSSDIKISLGSVSDVTSAYLKSAGSQLARLTMKEFKETRRNALLVFCDEFQYDHIHILAGIQEIFGKAFPITGAISNSSLMSLKETYQFYQDKPLTHALSAALIGGNCQIGLSHRHGFKPIGRPRFATKVQGATIKSIDHKRASFLYEEYFELTLDDLHKKTHSPILNLYPLGIRMDDDREYLLRKVNHILGDGSLVCQGDVPEGSEIHLMMTNKDFLKQSAMNAAFEIKDSFRGRAPKFILVMASLFRYEFLGKDFVKEIRAIRDILGNDIPLIGMCSSGEIAPLTSKELFGQAVLNNGTFSIMAVG